MPFRENGTANTTPIHLPSFPPPLSLSLCSLPSALCPLLFALCSSQSLLLPAKINPPNRRFKAMIGREDWRRRSGDLRETLQFDRQFANLRATFSANAFFSLSLSLARRRIETNASAINLFVLSR